MWRCADGADGADGADAIHPYTIVSLKHSNFNGADDADGADGADGADVIALWDDTYTAKSHINWYIWNYFPMIVIYFFKMAAVVGNNAS